MLVGGRIRAAIGPLSHRVIGIPDRTGDSYVVEDVPPKTLAAVAINAGGHIFRAQISDIEVGESTGNIPSADAPPRPERVDGVDALVSLRSRSGQLAASYHRRPTFRRSSSSLLGVAANQARHDRSIDNPKPVQTMHPQMVIHHRHSPLPHRARADRVMIGFAPLSDVGTDLLFALNIRTR